jgi:hypothetical protein
MPAPSTTEEFLDLVRKSGVVDDKRLEAYLSRAQASGKLPPSVGKAAGLLVRDGILTHFQAEQFLQGKWRRFTIGKYRVLERIGSGGMGSVYLCEHKFMRRRAAVKVLPSAKANDPSALERFYREARAVAALDHPNIVRAYDIDQEDQLHFLVMEYVDGTSLQDIVKQSGPLDPGRAAHYISQAAQGLQHAHDVAGLVHRDIKPGNLIVDRGGTVKILDMGLARFFNDEEDLLTRKYDENVLGTADYLAPEQALDSHAVDIRADIYGLGATFYFCLTGKPPFGEGSVAQKLIWHQTRQPKPIHVLRSDVPAGLSAAVDKMMAKDPEQRYQQPREVIEAVAPWAQAATLFGAADQGQTGAEATGNGSGGVGGDAIVAASKRAAAAARLAKNWEVKGPPRPATGPKPPPAPQAAKLPPPSSTPTASPTPAAAAIETSLPELPAGGDVEELTVPVIAAVQNRDEEDGLCWEKLAADTAELAAQGDTAPRSLRKPGRSTPGLVTTDRRRTWWIVGIISGVILLLLAVILLWAFAFDPGPESSGRLPVPSNPAPRRPPLSVSRTGPIRTLGEAIARAKDQDQIVVRDDIEEALNLDGMKTRIPAVTIEPANGRTVVWRLPKGDHQNKRLLFLNSVAGLCIHGLTLDGGDRVDQIAVLTGKCPGLTLDNLQLQGFKKSAMQIVNCAGTPDQPITLSELWMKHSGACDAALQFEVKPDVRDPSRNENFVVKDCWFAGVYKSPVQLTSKNTQGYRTFLSFTGNSVRQPGHAPEKGKPAAPAESVSLKNPED